MIVPELPADIAELKRQVARFIEDEVYPVEQRIVERNAIDAAEVDGLRVKARAAGFSMLNMPAELGGRDLSMLGQVALEEESGKATNGLGFAVVDRGPRELLELADAGAGREVRDADRAGRVSRGLGADRARGRLRSGGARSDGDARRRRVGAERREVVRHERGRRGVLPRGGRGRGRAGALHRRSGDARPRHLADAALPPRPVPRPPSRDRAHRLPGAGREQGLGRRLRLPRVDPGRAALHRGPLLRRRRAAAPGGDGMGAGARGIRRPDHREPGRLVPARRLTHRAARGTADDLPRGARLRHARRPQGRPRQGRDGEALRLGDGRPGRRPRRPDLRWPWLHARHRRRALLP